MKPSLSPCPQYVGPSPAVLKAIRGELKGKHLSFADRRMPAVTTAIAAEPVNLFGFNEGIFYPLTALPKSVAALAPSVAVRSRPTTGKMMCLVLLVDFSDNVGSPAAQFQDMLFSKGTFATGSMHDFYAENSCNQVDLDGTVVGWLRMPQKYSYYVDGKSGTGDYPTNAQKLVEDALTLASAQINLKNFDADGDGFIDGLFVVHAGGGAESDTDTTARKDKIWSHQWNLPQPFVANNTKAYSYCIQPEDGRVGVFCHEFGHMLGLPDLYDTTYKSEGVGSWCVMGAGSWNNSGDTPAHFCAWSKIKLGWQTPVNVRKPQSLTIAPVEDCAAGKIYRLWTKGKQGDEYFLIENRQLRGFDAKLSGSGLLIWHIDDTQHNNDHPGTYWVALVQADGRNDLEIGRNRGDKNDPFPGGKNVSTFDDASTPASIDNLGNSTSVAVRNITEANEQVTCDVDVTPP